MMIFICITQQFKWSKLSAKAPVKFAVLDEEHHMRKVILVCGLAAVSQLANVCHAANEKVVAVTASQFSYAPKVMVSVFQS
jgi:hypothetical protein